MSITVATRASLACLFDCEAADRQGFQNRLRRNRRVEPRCPIRSIEDGDLSIVVGSNVRPGFHRQHREGLAHVLIWPSNTGYAKLRLTFSSEQPFVLPLLLCIGRIGEFIEPVSHN